MSDAERELHAAVKTISAETLVSAWQRNRLAFWQEYEGIWKVTGTAVRIEGDERRPVLILAGTAGGGRTRVRCQFPSAVDSPSVWGKLTKVSAGDYLAVIGSMWSWTQLDLDETDCAVVVGAFDLWRGE